MFPQTVTSRVPKSMPTLVGHSSGILLTKSCPFHLLLLPICIKPYVELLTYAV